MALIYLNFQSRSSICPKMFTFILIAPLLFLLFAFNHLKFRYWKRHGISQNEQQTFLFGDFRDLFLQRKSMANTFADLHLKTKNEKIFGLYFTYRPIILINDYNLAKKIFTEDFHNFQARVILNHGEIHKMAENLMFTTGERWKNLRQKVTPAFSSLKLRQMMPVFEDSVKTLENFVGKNCEKTNFDVKELSARFTMTLLSSVAFGIVNDSINHPENVFNQMGLRVSDSRFKIILKKYLSPTEFCPHKLSNSSRLFSTKNQQLL